MDDWTLKVDLCRYQRALADTADDVVRHQIMNLIVATELRLGDSAPRGTSALPDILAGSGRPSGSSAPVMI